MSRPGTTTIRSETRPARSAPTGTGPGFAAGITGTADAAADIRKPCKSLAEYAGRFGSRASHADPSLYDGVDRFFQEDGAEVYVTRTVDATAPVLLAALALFTPDLGPGQVFAPGRVTAAQHVELAKHAALNNRVALHDGVNSANVATLTTLATPGTTALQDRVASLWAPWLDVPNPIGAGTVEAPPSAIVAGIMARNDANGVSQNQPSGGVLGRSYIAQDAVVAFSDADRTTLNANGVNILRPMFGGVRIYGYRTLADPNDLSESNYLLLSNARLYMAIQAVLEVVAERFVLREIDGQGLVIQEFGGALTGELLPFWLRGSLYGGSPDEAFRVDVGPNVNTEESIAAGELRANVALRMSPFAEEVILEIVKVKITEAV